MNRWEYKTLVLRDNYPPSEAVLNREGALGWELVAVTETKSGHAYLFKRPAQTEAEHDA